MAARSLNFISAQQHVRGVSSVPRTEVYIALQDVQYHNACRRQIQNGDTP